MSDIVINKTLRPTQHQMFQGNGFVGLVGQQAVQFSKQSSYATVLAEGKYGSVNEKFHGWPYKVEAVMIGGVIRGCVVKARGLMIGAYAFTAPEGKDHCLKMLEDCAGNDYATFAKLKDHFQSTPAMELYNWEEVTFKQGRAMEKALRILPVSVALAKEAVAKCSPTELLDWADTMKLLREMATDFGVYNLEVHRMPYGAEGNIIAYAAKADEHFTFGMGHNHKVCFSELTMKHTVIHEFAHVLNNHQDGASGHGNKFRETYEMLLRKYGGEENANVEIPRLPVNAVAIATENEAEQEIRNIEGSQF